MKLCPSELTIYWIKTLYFAAVAVRCLDPDELLDVMSLVMIEFWQFDEPSRRDAPRTPSELLRLMASLLVVNPDGKVQFRTDGTREYLLRSEFQGSENGDEYMARTCLQYLSGDDQPYVLKPWARYRHDARKVRGPFVRYAASQWHRHYRAAESENNDLAAMLHQTIEREARHLWGHPPRLHIQVQDLTLQMGLAVSTYYDFQLLTDIYLQMGASGPREDLCAVIVPFPSQREDNLCFSQARSVSCSTPPLPSNAASTWIDSLTDGESSLDESWASLPARPPSEQWITDFDDLRLGYDNRVFVHQGSRKKCEDSWEVVDRRPDVGF